MKNKLALDADVEALLERHKATVRCVSDLPPGWVGLADRLLDAVRDRGWDGRLAQVKEKFGALVVYFDGDVPPEWRDLANAAERDSRTVCQQCGQPGTLAGDDGCWATRCQPCRTAQRRRRDRGEDDA